MSTPRQKALERQALQEAEREKKRLADEEEQRKRDWAVGSKDSSRQKAAEDKEEEKRRKKAEKEALEAAEGAQADSIKKVGKTKKKGKDDADMLALMMQAKPKTKAEKLADEQRKAAEERRKQEEAARAQKELKLQQREEEARKAALKGMVLQEDLHEELLRPINNRLPEDDGEVVATGLSNAVDALAEVLGKGTNVSNMDKRIQNVWRAFYDEQFPIVKADNPGLKKTQIDERVHNLWVKSAANPANQVKVVQSKDAWKEEYGRQRDAAASEASSAASSVAAAASPK